MNLLEQCHHYREKHLDKPPNAYVLGLLLLCKELIDVR